MNENKINGFQLDGLHISYLLIKLLSRYGVPGIQQKLLINNKINLNDFYIQYEVTNVYSYSIVILYIIIVT